MGAKQASAPPSLLSLDLGGRERERDRTRTHRALNFERAGVVWIEEQNERRRCGFAPVFSALAIFKNQLNNYSKIVFYCSARIDIPCTCYIKLKR